MRRAHPKNPWIINSRAANLLIFFTRHHVPVISRLYMYFMGCSIGMALPRSVFLPHPMGIVIHRETKLGENVVVGHQVTLGGRDLTNASPNIEDGVYIGAGAKSWAASVSAVVPPSAQMLSSPKTFPPAPSSSPPTNSSQTAAPTPSINLDASSPISASH